MNDQTETLAKLPLKLRELNDALNNKNMVDAFEISDDIQNDCFGLKLFILSKELKHEPA
jgi:hypothetical protein